MTSAEILSSDLADVVQQLHARHRPFAFATIVRTAGPTAAKPGAKAILDAEGTILRGFLGGGCVRGAVKRAVLAALETGAPRLISVAPGAAASMRAIIVATQGQGDLDALTSALAEHSDHVAFVGSHRKFAALSLKLLAVGVAQDRIARVSSPAGLDIGAVTPDEIALSILAELTQLRRKPLRHDGDA